MGIMGQSDRQQQIIESFEQNLVDDQLGIQVFRDKSGLSFNHHWTAIKAIKAE